MPMTAEEKVARAAARRAVTVARHDALRADALRADALRVANRVPPEYQQWGSNRTRAWEFLSARLRGLAGRKEVRPGKIRAAMEHVKSIDGLTVEQCVALVNRVAAEDVPGQPVAQSARAAVPA